MGRRILAIALSAVLALECASPACAFTRLRDLDEFFIASQAPSPESARSLPHQRPGLPAELTQAPKAAAPSGVGEPALAPAEAPAGENRAEDGGGEAAAVDAGQAYDGVAGGQAARFSPVFSWPLSEGSPDASRVHALTSRGGRLLINGKPAKVLLEKRAVGGATEETLVHPEDQNVLVSVYHSPGSIEGFERKMERLRALLPLAQAGAAPRLIEHGETAVEGRGRVYFLVQERVEGRRLAEMRPGERPWTEVGKIFEKLERAGLALAVPGPDIGWLLARVMVGRTASGGEGAYLLDGEGEPKAPEALAVHYAMLGSLLKPAQPEPDQRTGQPQSASKPAAPAEASPSAVSPRAGKGALVTLAQALVEGGDAPQRTIRDLIAGLSASPDKATPELRGLLEEAIGDYLKAFESRSSLGLKLRFRGVFLPGGRQAGAARYTGLIDVYRKLLDARPDLAAGADVELLRRAFGPRLWGGQDPVGDEVLVSELTKLAPIVEILALRRPELLGVGDYAAILQLVDELSSSNYLSDGDGSRRRLRSDVDHLRAELEEGFHRAALKAPIEALRQAMARLDKDRWEPRAGFEGRLTRLSAARPELPVAMAERGVFAGFKEREEARASGDWTRPILHALPIVMDEKDRRAALLAARSGWLAYRAAHEVAVNPLAGENALAFYARVFGIGQLLGTQTALGPKVDLASLEREAWAAFTLLDFELEGERQGCRAKFKKILDEIRAIGDRKSADPARGLVQNLLLTFSLKSRSWTRDTLVEVLHLPRLLTAQRRDEIVGSLRAAMKGLLRDFDAGTPSSVAAVLLAGSFASGTPTADSGLDLFVLTRPGGEERTQEFVKALRDLGRSSAWPALKITVISMGEQLRALRRSFPYLAFSNDPEIADNPQPPEPFDAPTLGELTKNRLARGGFRKDLIRELQRP